MMLVMLTALVLLGGCGRVVPRGGESIVASAPEPRARENFEARELLPADLDLVVRLDLGKLRASLGGELPTLAELPLIGESQLDAITKTALATADVVWVAMRVSDFATGDRVIVAEARDLEPPEPSRAEWLRSPTEVPGLHRFSARARPARDGTAEIYVLGRRAVILVSPVEAASVRRVLALGPDSARPEPEARGLASLAFRASSRIPPVLRQFPSLERLALGIERVGVTLELAGTELSLDGRIVCVSELSATKLAQFLLVFRDAGAARAPLDGALSAIVVSAEARTVSVRWNVPRRALASLVSEALAWDPRSGAPLATPSVPTTTLP
ncbi:MAG: hypothetical protein EXR75_15455 [Myxococcales bacterium]|nr:hypothetical protein [Myxococcales bacterium]